MPAQGASRPVDGCGPGGAQSYDGRLYREAMARNKSPQDYNRDFDRRGGEQQPQEWDDADWDPDQEAAAGHRARRLLSRSNSGFHRFGDGTTAGAPDSPPLLPDPDPSRRRPIPAAAVDRRADRNPDCNPGATYSLPLPLDTGARRGIERRRGRSHRREAKLPAPALPPYLECSCCSSFRSGRAFNEQWGGAWNSL